MEYQFALNINDDNNNLNPRQGLDYGELSDLVRNLKGAINVSGWCSLFAIENHGYTPKFITNTLPIYEGFIEVHRNIGERGLLDLNRQEQVYAATLKKILNKGQFIEALDKDDIPISKIYSNEIEKGVETYQTITNQSGIITEIGAPKLDKTSHIYLDGITYKIYIEPQQDQDLREHYKRSTIDFKLKQRRSVKTNRVVSAQLITYKVKSIKTLSESLKELSQDDLSFLKDVNSYEDIIRLIHS